MYSPNDKPLSLVIIPTDDTNFIDDEDFYKHSQIDMTQWIEVERSGDLTG